MKNYDLFQVLVLSIASIGAIGNFILTLLHVLGKV